MNFSSVAADIKQNATAIGAATVTGALVAFAILALTALRSSYPLILDENVLIVGGIALLCTSLSLAWTTGYKIDTPLDSVSLFANSVGVAAILSFGFVLIGIIVAGESMPGLVEFASFTLGVAVFAYLPALLARDVFERYSSVDDEEVLINVIRPLDSSEPPRVIVAYGDWTDDRQLTPGESVHIEVVPDDLDIRGGDR